VDEPSPPPGRQPDGRVRRSLDEKTIDDARRESREPGTRLRSELGFIELTAIGLAIIVGAGIFTTAPTAYRDLTGPSIVIAFLVAAVPCLLVALCYAECTTRIPVAGSAYTFAYVAHGRRRAWFVSWLLVLEYTAGSAVVAKSWSLNLNELLGLVRPGDDREKWTVVLGAVLIVGIVVAVLSLGVKAASAVAVAATATKVLVLLAAVVVTVLAAVFGAVTWDPAANPSFFLSEPHPADPDLATLVESAGAMSAWPAATALLFYAFIGFDSVSTLAEDARFPARDLWRATVASLGVATVLYLAVAVLMVGLVPGSDVAGSPTLASIFAGRGLGFFSPVLTVGALLGLTTGILVLLLSQSRIALAMSRDRLLPRWVGTLSWRRTPTRLLRLFGVLCAVFAVFPANLVQPMVNCGTLLIFIIVCRSTIVLRRRPPPPVKGTFRFAGGKVWAHVGMVLCSLLLLFNLCYLYFVSWPALIALVVIICLPWLTYRLLRNEEESDRHWSAGFDEWLRRRRWIGEWKWRDS
jgi:basic amino acid/polyamine antiporter, APA family